MADPRSDSQILFPDYLESCHELTHSPVEEQQYLSDTEMMMRKETEQLKPVDQQQSKQLQTRRQSKGLTYFNRTKPTVLIDVGTLEEWHTARLEQQAASHNKRRRLNMTMVEDSSSDQSDQGSDDQQMIDLNYTVDEQAQLNKHLLYEGWLDDFEKQKKQQLRNNKKRKRSQHSKKSRSPTPVSNRGANSLQFDISKSRKASVKNSEESKQISSAPMVTDSEEERKELEKIKTELLNHLAIKDEPLTIMQLSYATKYQKQYCDEAMAALIQEGKCRRKEINKNTVIFSLVRSDP